MHLSWSSVLVWQKTTIMARSVAFGLSPFALFDCKDVWMMPCVLVHIHSMIHRPFTISIKNIHEACIEHMWGFVGRGFCRRHLDGRKHMWGTWMRGSIWEALGWAGVYGSWWEPDRSAPPDRSRGRAKWEGGREEGGQPQQQGQVVMGKDRQGRRRKLSQWCRVSLKYNRGVPSISSALCLNPLAS